MKKKGPRRRRKPCEKQCFPTKAVALWAVRKTNIGLVRAYRCGQHNLPTWHTTSKA